MTNAIIEPENLLTMDEVAARLAIRKYAAYQLTWTGDLPVVRVGRRRVRVRPEDVAAYIDRQLVQRRRLPQD
jgi:excisionase family DNA binding protein